MTTWHCEVWDPSDPSCYGYETASSEVFACKYARREAGSCLPPYPYYSQRTWTT